MKAQVSLEMLINTVVWLAFISAIAIGLINFQKNTEHQNAFLTHIKNVHQITNQIEQIQGTGFSVGAAIMEHKYRNGSVTLDYNGKEIVEKTIFGVDKIYGQPV